MDVVFGMDSVLFRDTVHIHGTTPMVVSYLVHPPYDMGVELPDHCCVLANCMASGVHAWCHTAFVRHVWHYKKKGRVSINTVLFKKAKVILQAWLRVNDTHSHIHSVNAEERAQSMHWIIACPKEFRQIENALLLGKCVLMIANTRLFFHTHGMSAAEQRKMTKIIGNLSEKHNSFSRTRQQTLQHALQQKDEYNLSIHSFN
jgi:hypothetical protein